jgi:diguanylate cyclase (GGDEF)-like protein
MTTILLVEDSRTFASLLSRNIESALGFSVRWTQSYQETAQELESGADKYFAALLDLNLPDAPRGEVVDLVAGKGVPSIVFTGEMDRGLRRKMWANRIADYVYKDNLENVGYLLQLLQRLSRNRGVEVLVVDDSPTARSHVASLLRARLYQVLEAADGKDALAVLAEHPDVKLVVTDYNMPGMDGFQLTREIRRSHSKDVLAIIGVSAQAGDDTSARFIKTGANDFISKPFNVEEFYCRIMHNMEMLEQVETIRELSIKDPLTGLYNRRHFFDAGHALFQERRAAGRDLCAAMLDIDHFKRVNDTWGHDAGDAVLKYLASILQARFGNGDIVARFGGEEFCVLFASEPAADAPEAFDALRRSVEAAPVTVGDAQIPFTVSIGMCTRCGDTLEATLKQADELLYRSKQEGRNRVTVDRG